MQLTKNFSLAELTVTRVPALDNTPNALQIANLKLLCINVLQPVRDHFGTTVVNSGFRSLAVNRAINGTPGSEHCNGQAADIEVLSASNFELAKWISKNLKFTQLILEFPGADGSDGWVHVSYNPKNLKNQVLTAKKVNGKTKYLPGLIPA